VVFALSNFQSKIGLPVTGIFKISAVYVPIICKDASEFLRALACRLEGWRFIIFRSAIIRSSHSIIDMYLSVIN
jgi:hypothetical protein